jgi:hypothetical protein
LVREPDPCIGHESIDALCGRHPPTGMARDRRSAGGWFRSGFTIGCVVIANGPSPASTAELQRSKSVG